ncbi:beta family protein [Alteromonas sp. KUL106]|uniref:beta family protein n=1 Tax=Alteromonas sp. KUL106 TaxID=2480799 RepID=UPI0012E6EB1A|nr:beta family protein [Alteromonas sp. KUL106]GFD67919.1 hypothetical protein KUL106_11820 [Alteromonas sp. KUL106]
MKKLYYPILKTRDAELRAMKHLSVEVLQRTCPIYELTKSRKTTKVPDGDIHRRMKVIEEIQGHNEFILDLSTDETYTNPQIKQLLSPYHGFSDWFYFVVENYRNLNIIPTVHIYEDEDGFSNEVSEFVRKMSQIKTKLALRLPHDLGVDDILEYLKSVIEAMDERCKLIIIFDAGHVTEAEYAKVIGSFTESCEAVERLDRLESIVVASSSFPSDVKNSGGHDAEGDFAILEEKIYLAVKDECPIVECGDYASINTEQIEMRGGTFVPRLDIVTEDCNRFVYKRYRRDDGSYPRCAKQMLKDKRYKGDNGWWSNDEIALASNDVPNGISPAYWISVRVDYYINMKIKKRLEELELPER